MRCLSIRRTLELIFLFLFFILLYSLFLSGCHEIVLKTYMATKNFKYLLIHTHIRTCATVVYIVIHVALAVELQIHCAHITTRIYFSR